MVKLTAANAGSFYIDFGNGVNVPFMRGQLVPRFERDGVTGYPTGKVAFEAINRVNDLAVPFLPATSYIDGSSDTPFEDLAALIAFIVANINPTGTGGGGGGASWTPASIDIPALTSTVTNAYFEHPVYFMVSLNGGAIDWVAAGWTIDPVTGTLNTNAYGDIQGTLTISYLV